MGEADKNHCRRCGVEIPKTRERGIAFGGYGRPRVFCGDTCRKSFARRVAWAKRWNQPEPVAAAPIRTSPRTKRTRADKSGSPIGGTVSVGGRRFSMRQIDEALDPASARGGLRHGRPDKRKTPRGGASTSARVPAANTARRRRAKGPTRK